jgi:hypothetical protein
MNLTPVEDAVAGALRDLDAPPAAPDLFASVQKGVQRRARRRAAVVAGAVAVVGAALGTAALDAGRGGDLQPAATIDAVQVLRAGSSVASEGRYWSTLRGVLPNVTYTYDSAGRQMREQVTDSVVIGRVVRTEPAHGMLGEPLVAGEDVRSRVVAFDDPRAAWRVLSVTVQVTETLAGTPADELVLDWTLLGPSDGGQDARVVGKAFEDLGTLVVLSKAAPTRPEFVPGRSPLPSGYGIGRVAADGGLDFPLIAPNEGPSAAAFQDGIDTLSELRDEARKPTKTESAVPEQGQ